ncbi:MAG: DNA repair exonuclease [Lactococcus sp.]|jgi:DNA repair exonuclease SbcCD nuclease subunit|uniref:DNA repair exonuclease family protein YhaO n=1 Tax=Pseudolactococcus piscium MKFS47 TaxID=297352 RepID=A0A0D6DV09_9LACT|nr:MULTISPECIES: DNA repair exonuclease [Lactococcus]SOB47018.1 DNA double-strand break repair protein Mre11 [Lactococcus piscium]MBR6894767.1 DNA repair exonuclease [Lactococcus sp.]MCJ1969345.1 DNA repair exonuclease [Lactococcus carnosus]MCJ1971831.1 DNA repair exonuclease [Lactococcus carnosus]MCJ1973444.1 DNA repair exonuclease [Lactococcus carnosus]
MKFIHTADLHLDREFEGLVQEVAYQPYKILEKIIDFAIVESVEVIFFAGDNFHQSLPSIKIQTYFAAQLARLAPHGIQAVVIFGNHDYYRESVYWVQFSDNVTVFHSESVKTKKLTLKTGETLAVSGFSYQHPHISEDKIVDYPLRDYTCDYHVGLFHGEISGHRFAPANLSDMLSKDYNYWALGHIHLASQLADSVIYSGTPQGRNKKEATNLIVYGDILPSGNLIYFQDLAEVHFETLTLDLSDCQTLSQVLTYITSNLTDEAICYSLNLKNYEDVADNLQEAIENEELLEELRQKNIIVKLKLLPLTSNKQLLTSIEVPEFAMPAIDFTDIYSLVPHKKDIKAIFDDPEFIAEVQENISLYVSQYFEFGGSQDEN